MNIVRQPENASPRCVWGEGRRIDLFVDPFLVEAIGQIDKTNLFDRTKEGLGDDSDVGFNHFRNRSS